MSNKLLLRISLHIVIYLIKTKIFIFRLFFCICIWIFMLMLMRLLSHECTFYHHYVFTLFIFVNVDITEIGVVEVLDVLYGVILED